MIVVGIDPHMKTHTAVAIDAVTGHALGEKTVGCHESGREHLLAWARGLAEKRVFAIEDCLPEASVAGSERDVRLLVDHRDDLVGGERARINKRLRWKRPRPRHRTRPDRSLRNTVRSNSSSFVAVAPYNVNPDPRGRSRRSLEGSH